MGELGTEAFAKWPETEARPGPGRLPIHSRPSAARQAKVFISYSRKDAAFAQQLVDRLAASGFDAFLDKTDIAPGEPWRERLAGLIAASDTVVFVVSPDAVASEICAWELEESVRRGKRVMPVVTRRIADEQAPQTLGRLNFIFCTENDDCEAAFSALDEALRTDLPWVREHTRLGELAQRWQDRGRAKSATLRGADLDAAERWLDRRPADANAPTELHHDFIRASRRATTSRQRSMVGGAAIVALVALALAGWAEINRREAQTQRERAERTLALATKTANSLVFDLAEKFRHTMGVPAGTIKAILDRSRELQDQLLGSGESSAELRRSQANALLATAETLLTLGEAESALAAAQRAREIFTTLSKQFPEDTDLQRDLSISYILVGDVPLEQGKPAEALKSYQQSLVIAERLAKSDSGNAAWQRDMSASYDKIGNALEAQGNLVDALKSYQASLDIADRLDKSDPGNAILQDDVSVSYEKIGGVLKAQGNLTEALKSYQASLAIREWLAKSDPSNSELQRGLAVSYGRVGEMMEARGNLAEALNSYQANLAIMERLVKSDPGNSGWQRDLSISYEKVGHVLLAQGSLAEALKSNQASLAIIERLAKSHPGNAGWAA
jgi:tetratricopeptide (TPR) repeat protein